MNLKPLFDRVVLKNINQKKETLSGIIIPESVGDEPLYAEVIAIGNGDTVEGEKIEMTVNIGDKVLYNKYGAVPFDAVKITLGPKGKNAVLDRKFTTPLITNDGVTIAKEIELEDPFENIGANLIKEVSIKTNDLAGDGTTTACVLVNAIVQEGFKNIASGANPIILRKGIEKAIKLVTQRLKEI